MRAHLRSAAARLDMLLPDATLSPNLLLVGSMPAQAKDLMGTIEALIVSDLACNN